MIFNNSVTVYHNTGKGFSRKFFVRTNIFEENSIDTGDGGQTSKNSFIIRVFTHDTPDIACGDRLVIGYCEAVAPPDDSRLIVSVTKNSKGSGNMRHYKLKAV